MSPAPLVDLHDREACGAVGGKASTLLALVRAGFDVPPFAVVEAAFLDAPATPESDRELSGAVVARLGNGPFAVRSSAVGEDGATDSHAGQFLSLLDVGAADVPDAARRVRDSGREDSVSRYREARGASGPDVLPGVIVQVMVAPRAAGVAFSCDPASGRRDVVAVSAVAGLADLLAGGEVDGETYILNRDGTLAAPADGTVLSPDDLARLVDLAVRVERWAGGAQDVEWAFAGDRLRLLQARPVTTPLRPLPVPDPEPVVLDNSNVVESYPGLVSPLTYSFARYAYARVYPAFVRLLGVDEATVAANRATFENMLCRVDGRVYYNLGNWYRALAMLPGFGLNRGFMETMMGVDDPLPPSMTDAMAPPPATGMASLRECLRLARTGAGLLASAARLPRTKAAFDERFERALAGADAETVRGMPATDLARLYRRVEADLLDRWDAPLVNDFLCMVAFGLSKRLCESWVGPEGASLHNAYMIGQGDVVSAVPARLIREMGVAVADHDAVVAALADGDGSRIGEVPGLRGLFDAYVARFGDRCAEELKLESPTLHDDPAPLYRAVAGSARTPRRERESVDADAALAGALRGRPVRRNLLFPLLGYARARVRDRENLRFQRTRIFGLARRTFLAIGARLHERGLLDEPRDVLHLHVDEVLGAVEGFGADADLASLAAARKAATGRSAAAPDPAGRLVGEGMVARVANRPPGTAARSDDSSRTGTGCSRGKVVARARVVTDPNRQSLSPGDVLVARHTDPGWIALFANASAIVVERGSLLSHSAIVARELGIPCVVGVKGATTWIGDGSTISVDGGSGVVERVDG